MNREEIINKLVQFWTEQLGQPSDFGCEPLTSNWNKRLLPVSDDHKELFRKTLKSHLDSVSSFEDFYLEVDYDPCEFLDRVLGSSMLWEHALPGKTSSWVDEKGRVIIKCGYNGEFKELK